MDLEASPGSPVLLCGGGRDGFGTIVLRNLEPSEDMGVLGTIKGRGSDSSGGGDSVGHSAAVASLITGPRDFFFSGGGDGRFAAWQIVFLPPPT